MGDAKRIQAGFRECVSESITKYADAATWRPIANRQSVDPPIANRQPSIVNQQSPIDN
jgi:hypothetical protein